MRRAAVAALSAAACACGGAAPPPAPAETGPEANAAIVEAKACSGDVTDDGYTLLIEQATARRDTGRAGAWIVTFPPGAYHGRLPPPGPGLPRVVLVDLTTHACSWPERKR